MPALMAGDWKTLLAKIDAVRDVARVVQVDVMDGVFVSPRSFPYTEISLNVSAFPYGDILFYEVHLMVQDPQDIGSTFIRAGAKRIIGHIESFDSVDAARRCLRHWRAEGVQAGISLLINTPLAAITPLIESGDVDVVQVMSIAEIGYQGHPFDERAIERVRALRKQYPELTISVDGGVSKENARTLVDAGADILCVGSAILKSKNPHKAYAELERIVV